MRARPWILSAITTEVIIIMHLFMFVAVIKLRYSRPDAPQPYKVPGGKAGVWIVARIALAALVCIGPVAYAFRQIQYRMGRGLPPAVIYTAGDAVIQVSRAALTTSPSGTCSGVSRSRPR